MLRNMVFTGASKLLGAAYALSGLRPLLPAGLFDPIIIFFYKIAITICTGISIFLWQFNRLLLSLALLMALFNDILVTYVFRTGIATIGGILRVEVLPFVFTLAVFVLGVSYTLSAFFVKELNLVDWKKAIAWLLGAILFYSAGADIFAGSESFRRGLGGFMYSRLLGVEVNDGTDCVGAPLSNLTDPDTGETITASELLGRFSFSGTSGDLQMDCLRNHFGDDFRTDNSIDGIDVAMSYLFASDDDFFTADRALPKGYYSASRGQLYGFEARYYPYFDDLDDLDDVDDAEDALGLAADGIQRMFFGIFLIVFGIVEQYIFLILSLAMGVIFFLLLFAILLAFFNHTEFVANSILQQWMQMMLTGLFCSILQASALFILLLSTISLNPLIPLGASVISIALVLLSAKTATEAVMGVVGGFASALGTAAGVVSKGVVGGGALAARGAFGAANFASRGGLGRTVDKAGSALSSGAESVRSGVKKAGDWWYKRNRGGSGAGATPASTGIDSIMKPVKNNRVAIGMHRMQADGAERPKVSAAFGSNQGTSVSKWKTGISPGRKTTESGRPRSTTGFASTLTPPQARMRGDPNVLRPQSISQQQEQRELEQRGGAPKMEALKVRPTTLHDAVIAKKSQWQRATPSQAARQWQRATPSPPSGGTDKSKK